MLDNCCGTGSFLVSALRYMIKKSDGDKAKEKNIKEKQIVGIEKEQDMFDYLVHVKNGKPDDVFFFIHSTFNPIKLKDAA